MRNRRVLFGTIFTLALAMTGASFYKLNDASKSSAAVMKNPSQAVSQTGLSNVTYNGENMYVAKSTFYDYYSDSQVGTSSTPGVITDAKKTSLNTFGKFNTRLMEIMKYNNSAECPAQYPLYQGRHGSFFSDFANIYNPNNNEVNEKSNFWMGANYNQIGSFAMQGLVDKKLTYASDGTSYITQSNSTNGKSSYLPYFDKNVLTKNKFEGSELTLGSVKENVAFPFRREEKDGITYYEFDSASDIVRFNTSGQLDYKGKDVASESVDDATGKPAFFPYNEPKDGNSNSLNFGYGVKIEVPFNMTNDGKLNGKDMIFEFTGDDDVWVYIDGILALDLGGGHPKVSGTINFAEGKSVVSGVKNPTVAYATRTINNYGVIPYTNASLGLSAVPTVYYNFTTNFSDELKAKLADTSKTHTLTLFYMERGMNEANMKMKFNLPEPTKLTVENKIDVENVGVAFKEETKKVASSETFLYDVIDKTNNKKSVIDMINGDNVLFSNEFNLNDIILLQESGLKATNRKLTELYATSWILKDIQNEISKGNGVIVKDSRNNDNTVLFKNQNDDKNPVLTSTFTNAPLVGKFNLKSDVSEEYKQKNTNYQEKTFKYIISYKDVFGGGSQEKVYVGKYIVTNTQGTTSEKETTDGVIELKPGEKVEIVGIPVLTEVAVKVELGETCVVSKIKTTKQFVYTPGVGVTTGKINNLANIVEYIIGDASEKSVEDKDQLTNDEIKDITGDDSLTNVAPEEPIIVDGDKYDDMPDTGDETNPKTWALVMGISLLLTLGSSIMLTVSKNKR